MSLQRFLTLAAGACVLIGALVLLLVPRSISEAVAVGLGDQAKHLLGFAGLTILAPMSMRRDERRLALAGLAVSFIMLGAYFSSYYCGLRAVGGDTGFGTVMTAMPVIDAISGMPVSIGGVGVREKLFQVLLHDLDRVPAETAVAAGLPFLLFTEGYRKTPVGDMPQTGRFSHHAALPGLIADLG